MAEALKRNIGDVTKFRAPSVSYISLPLKIFSKIKRILQLGKFDYQHSLILSKAYAQALEKIIKSSDFDLIFAPAASSLIAFLKTDIPIVYVSDTTFANMINYYPGFTGLTKRSVIEGNEVERLALNNATLCLFSSEWALKSAMEFYSQPEKKLHFIPMGANIESHSTNIPLRQDSEDNCCRLLFLGVNWERKGGNVAIDCLKSLHSRGVRAKLTICGCEPSGKIDTTDVELIPFLDKNNPDDFKKFESILFKTDFLILPTRAECFGIVFCEASAYGIPSIAYDTGGVSSAIKNGINGYLLPIEAQGSDFAEIIEKVYSDKDAFLSLKRSSRKFFEEILNWDAWAKSALKHVNEIL
jgi:glycosyltransferase involved in cell wall biosynthesis